MTKTRVMIFGVLVLILLGVISYFTIVKPENETAKVQITAEKLLDEFLADEQLANEKYLGKTINLSGTVSAIDIGETTVLHFAFNDLSGVQVELKKDQLADDSLIGKQILVQGNCSGFLLDVILNNGKILEK